MMPKDDKLMCIPDEYSLTVVIPPQGLNLFPKKEVEEIQLQGKSIVLALLIVTLLLNHLAGKFVQEDMI